MVLGLLLACAEPEAESGDVSWSGWVYLDQDSEQPLADGSVEFWLAGASEPILAEQPYADDYPGYWAVVLPAGEAVNVRVSATGARSTWWAGNAPTADGSWFGGALFAATQSWIDTVFTSLGEDPDYWAPVFDEPAGIVLGYPANSEVRCGDIALWAPLVELGVVCWTLTADGTIAPGADSDVAAWFAAAVPEGAVLLGVGSAREAWEVAEGELVLPWYLTGGD